MKKKNYKNKYTISRQKIGKKKRTTRTLKSKAESRKAKGKLIVLQF